jgi:rhamnose transport system ATP-binding protein
VLRDGKYIGTWNVAEIGSKELISAMVGREIEQIYPEKTCAIGDDIFRIEDFSRMGFFSNVNFSLRKGEILGFAGLVGAGRTDVMQSVFGIIPPDSGAIYLYGEKLTVKKTIDAMNAGIGLLPEDRQKQSLILDWEIFRNITISNLKPFTHLSVIHKQQEQNKAKTLGEKIAIKATTVFEKVKALSGGNQQKVVICKMLNSDLRVLILDEPTKGVDVGAKSQIYEIMNGLAAQGYGIIMISSDMPEIFGMSDRIIAMYEGCVTGEFLRGEATQEEVLAAVMNLEGVNTGDD